MFAKQYSRIFDFVLAPMLRRNNLTTLLSLGFILTVGSVTLVRHVPLIGRFVSPTAAHAGPGDEPRAQSLPNPADPLDPAYRPNVDTDPHNYPRNVWVTDAMQKVHPDTGNPGSLHGAILSAARNEFADFQVHVQAGARPMSLTVAASDLVNSRTGTVISHRSNIIVYREAYMDISTRSNANGNIGFIPDILIPAIDPYYHQARNAFPYALAAHENQSTWIDVLVPPRAPSGYYVGTITVLDGDTTLATLPVLLSVWNFNLPSTATLRTAFRLTGYGLCVQAYGSEVNCGAYPKASGNWILGVDLSHVDQAVMFLDHRISLSNVIFNTPYDNDWTSANRLYGPLLNGTVANTATMLSGAQLTNVEFNGGGNATRQQWASNFRAQGWTPKLYDYTCDEPPENCDWADIHSKALAARGVTPPMPALVTTSIHSATVNNVLSSIDILAPVVDQMHGTSGANQRSTYNSWLATAGHRLWWYQSCDEASTCSNGRPGGAEQTYGNYMIDSTPVRNRVFQWLAYMYGIETELYYYTDYCWSTSCGYPASTTDPWKSIYVFGGNGDGTLDYPGVPARIGGTIPIPLPSIRLKLIRDGMQDYEYLIALDKAGYGNFARTAVRSFITNAYTFDNNSEAMIHAREVLGAQLHLLTLSPPVIPAMPESRVSSQ
jgi:hypothetical protein